jgi:hypothetical protein
MRIDDSSIIVAAYFEPEADFMKKVLTHLNYGMPCNLGTVISASVVHAKNF